MTESNRLHFRFNRIRLLILLLTPILLFDCSPSKKNELAEEVENEDDHVIEIVTENMEFIMPDTLRSGWQTFRYVNKSAHTHFFLLDKYPEGKTIEDTEREVGPYFQKGMDLIMEGKPEEGYAEFQKLPEWFYEVVFSGGSGLISPYSTCKTTLKIEPGLYIVECYVKMANGMFHTSMGMAKQIIVEDDSTDYPAPLADINISISSEEGILYDKAITKGGKTFSVHYKDQIVHENFVGHDINLVKFNDYPSLEVLEKWLNWADPEGLITPAPEGLIFMGGVNDMPGGSTGYFTATLEPGNYALVSEVPDAMIKNLLKTFTVPE